MKNDLISVIIPVYNVEQYLDSCLDSVLNNTYRNIEVICVNDGSADGSLRILEHYAAADARVKIIDKENRGVSNTRNTGLKAAAGDWICFVDSDDWIHPQFFEILTSIGEMTGADIVIGNHVRVKEKEDFEKLRTDDIRHVRADINMIYRSRNMKNFVWGKLYRKEVISGLKFDETISYGEDFLFNAMIYSKADRLNIISTDTVLYFYNNREGSVINTIDNADRLRQGAIYIGASAQTENEAVSKICLTEGFKRVMLARYTERYTKNRPEVLSGCNTVLKKNIGNLWNNRKTAMKEKIVYTLFTYFPQAYRYWRIKDDPTMKVWEKSNQT